MVVMFKLAGEMFVTSWHSSRAGYLQRLLSGVSTTFSSSLQQQ